jgi:3-oxoacyl-[acyl-carrier-protein] synthase III
MARAGVLAMDLFTPGHTRLLATGAWLPPVRIGSAALMRELDSPRRFGLDHHWLERTTGVRERAAAAADLQPADLAWLAACEALERARVDPARLGLLVFSGVHRDGLSRSAAQLVAARLGARHAVALDVTNAAHGFVAGLHLADRLMAVERLPLGLVVTGDAASGRRRQAVERLQRSDDRALLQQLLPALSAGDCGAALLVAPKLERGAGFVGFMMAAADRHGDAAAACESSTAGERCDRFLRAVGWTPRELACCAVPQRPHPAAGRRGAGEARRPILETASHLGRLASGHVPVGLHLLGRHAAARPGAKVLVVGSGGAAGDGPGAASHVGLVWH